MKNLLKNRKGFTLAEILLVVAIVVILSGATVIGVASWVNQSKATADQLVAKNADFEASAVKDVNEKKGTLSTDPVETETLATGNNEGNGGGEETQNNNNNNNNNNNINSGNATEAPETTTESTTESTAASGDSTQGTTKTYTGSGPSSGSFTTQSGTHWDPDVDLGYDEWGNHRTGANVPDTASQGNISFGSTAVQKFTVSVSGKVLYYQCQDWKYTVTDNGDGTYTFEYTANQYKDNPPGTSIQMYFKVDGDKAADIKVTSYTEYKK